MSSRFCLRSLGVCVEFRVSGNASCVINGFKGLFARRYVPEFSIGSSYRGYKVGAVIYWLMRGEGFEVLRASFGDTDEYLVRSSPPAPYINESPYFFVLQVLFRLYVRAGYLPLTDSVTFYINRGAVLVLGYPHTGKSTLLALALAHGYVPLTTENTVLELRGGEAYVVGGTDVLVYDPEVERVYGVEVPKHERTRHGYAVLDLSKAVPERGDILRGRPKIRAIYVPYCSFSSQGFSGKEVKGRKAVKTLWHFATAVIRGTDYYDPRPLNLSDEVVDTALAERIKELASSYRGRFYEVFGSHLEVLKGVAAEVVKG